MSKLEVEPLVQIMEERIDDLEEKQKQAEEKYSGDGSTQAVWKKVEPKIRRRVTENCIEEIDESDDWKNLLLSLAKWKRKKNDEWEFNQRKPGIENERKSIKRNEIKQWIEELTKLIPDSEFETCLHCKSQKMPVTDEGYNQGFRWECSDCF
jgi:hypothetical protein